MSSSLRNVGEVETALGLLLAERENGEDHLSDALACTTALCLASLGREREGLSLRSSSRWPNTCPGTTGR